MLMQRFFLFLQHKQKRPIMMVCTKKRSATLCDNFLVIYLSITHLADMADFDSFL